MSADSMRILLIMPDHKGVLAASIISASSLASAPLVFPSRWFETPHPYMMCTFPRASGRGCMALPRAILRVWNVVRNLCLLDY